MQKKKKIRDDGHGKAKLHSSWWSTYSRETVIEKKGDHMRSHLWTTYGVPKVMPPGSTQTHAEERFSNLPGGSQANYLDMNFKFQPLFS